LGFDSVWSRFSQGILSTALEIQFPDELCLPSSHFQFLKILH